MASSQVLLATTAEGCASARNITRSNGSFTIRVEEMFITSRNPEFTDITARSVKTPAIT